MTDTYTETEASWSRRDLPVAAASASMVSAWSTDAGIARQAAELAAVYGNEFDVDTILRLHRSQLRAAAMATADNAASAIVIRSVLDGGVAELVDADTSDTALNALVTAAEAGYGSPIPGLLAELELLRAAESE